jgi:phage tail-like protein
MPPTFRADAYPAFNFQLTVIGVSPDGKAATACFTEISGLGIEMPSIAYRGGNENIRFRQTPGVIKYTNLVCKFCTTGDITFLNWINKAMQGLVQRADGSVILLDENRNEVMRWNFTNGWPCKYTGPGLNAKNNEIAIETVEIVHEGLAIG